MNHGSNRRSPRALAVVEVAPAVADTEEAAAAAEEAVEEGAGARRTMAREVVVEEAQEGLGIRFLLVATTVVLILALPVCLALSTGRASGIAATLAGMFG